VLFARAGLRLRAALFSSPGGPWLPPPLACPSAYTACARPKLLTFPPKVSTREVKIFDSTPLSPSDRLPSPRFLSTALHFSLAIWRQLGWRTYVQSRHASPPTVCIVALPDFPFPPRVRKIPLATLITQEVSAYPRYRPALLSAR